MIALVALAVLSVELDHKFTAVLSSVGIMQLLPIHVYIRVRLMNQNCLFYSYPTQEARDTYDVLSLDTPHQEPAQ